MEVLLPPMKSWEIAHKCGPIEQLAGPAVRLTGTLAKYTSGTDKGHLLLDVQGSLVAYIFAKPPIGAFNADAAVLVVKGLDSASDEADLRNGYWLQHPYKSAQAAPARDEALSSWKNAFQFIDEASAGGRPALRAPQVGALHSIHAHWSTSEEVATVVMPTGTGKTETMLSTLVSDRCFRVLIIVPTDALRAQIANKFLTLGLLKVANNAVLSDSAHRPVVGTLLKKPTSPEEVDAFFGPSNVVVTTSQLAGGCTSDVRVQMAKLCTHLFIDEAHHVEAETWRDLKAKFSSSKVLQFTATPFREDGQLIDGRVIYVYPLRKAMAEGYFRPIRFSSVYEFDVARADHAIALKAVEELELDATGKHVVMARVANIKRAEAVFETYRAIGKFDPVVLHTSLSPKVRGEATRKLATGQSRVVVCVDMLGEGFDMPELKIAAFHDVRKSLAVTLQLAGRFTWTLGMPGAVTLVVALAGCIGMLLPWPIRHRHWFGLAVLPVLMAPTFAPSDDGWTVNVIDVGQGMAVLIEGRGFRLLYDTGPRYGESSDAGVRVVVPWLKARGITRLDALVISHDDDDHVGGALSVLSAIDVDRVYGALPPMHPVVQAAKAFTPCRRGEGWSWHRTRFEWLHPWPDRDDVAPPLGRDGAWRTAKPVKVKDNARSCVLRIEGPAGSVLLPGDIEAKQERALLAHTPANRLKADLLLAPHHGSLTSSTSAFVAAVDPQTVVFQVGYRNRFEHPRAAVIDRYRGRCAQLLRSDASGAITLQMRPGEPWQVSRWRVDGARYWHLDMTALDQGMARVLPPCAVQSSDGS